MRLQVLKMASPPFWRKALIVMLTIIGLYTIIILSQEVIFSLSGLLNPSLVPPDSVCVPLFTFALDNLRAAASSTILMYSYKLGIIDLWVCSPLNNTQVNSILGLESTDSLLLASGDSTCDPSHTNLTSDQRTAIIASSTVEDSKLTVAQVLDTLPFPSGYQWAFATSKLTTSVNATYVNGNRTDVFSACSSFKFRAFNLPACKSNFVARYQKSNIYVRICLVLALCLTVVTQLSQFFYFICYKSGETTRENQAFIDRGIWPGFKVIWHTIATNEWELHVDQEASIKDFFFWWVFLTDLMSGIIGPAIAIYGCNVNSFKTLFVLIILHVALIIWHFFNGIKNRNIDKYGTFA